MDTGKGQDGHDISHPGGFSIEIPEDQSPINTLLRQGDQEHCTDDHKEPVCAGHGEDGFVIVIGEGRNQQAYQSVSHVEAGIICHESQNYSLTEISRVLGCLPQ